MPDWKQTILEHGNEFSELVNLLGISNNHPPASNEPPIRRPSSPPPPTPPRRPPSPPRVRGPRREVSKIYQGLLHIDDPDLITNGRRFECPICFVECGIGTGIVLRGCKHSFCLQCARETIKHAEEAEVKCPLVDGPDNKPCTAIYEDREIRALLPKEDYDRYLDLSFQQAAKRSPDAFLCKTPNCPGWCVKPNCNTGETIFHCPKCKKSTCVMCDDPHPGMTCEDYRIRKANDNAAQEDQKAISGLLANKAMIKCPGCGVLVEKSSGCDNIICASCKIEICWATGKKRRGPDGCRCREIGGQPCHPKCQNCH